MVVGIDQGSINKLSSQIYSTVYPTLFKGEALVDKPLLYSVDYDIRQAPVFTLQPNEEVIPQLKEQAKTLSDDAEITEALCEHIDKSTVTFSMDIKTMTFGITPTKGQKSITVDGSISTGCVAEIDTKGRIVPVVTTAKIALPKFETLAELLNKLALPYFIDVLNTFLKNGIILQVPSFAGVEFSPPVARIENNMLAAYSALKSTGPTVLPPSEVWPVSKEFVVFDEAVAVAVASGVLAVTQKSGSTSTKIEVWPFPKAYLDLSASYHVGVKDPVFVFQHENLADMGVSAYGGGSVSAKLTGLPAIPLGLTITASPLTRARLSIVNGEILYTIYAVDSFNVDLDIEPIPSVINKFISLIISSLTTPIAQLIGVMLQGLTIPVYYVGPQHFTEEGIDFMITPVDQVVGTIQGPDGKKLASVMGDLQVRKSEVNYYPKLTSNTNEQY